MQLEKIKGARVGRNKYGSYLEIKRELDDLDCGGIGSYIKENLSRLRQPLQGVSRFPAFSSLYKKELAFLDIESCGFRNSDPISMITFVELNEHLRTRVLVARDYLEEGGVLYEVLKSLRESKEGGDYALFTYNGASFDLPRIKARAISNGICVNGNQEMGEWLREGHVDLYQVVRNVFGNSLPDNKLPTLEQSVFGHQREEDIAGRSIPMAYKNFVQKRGWGGREYDEERSEAKMKKIIDHNTLDVWTMVALAAYFCSPEK